MKQRLYYLIALTIACLEPVSASAAEMLAPEIVYMVPEKEVSVSYNDGALYVTGAEGSVLEVITLTGKKLLQAKIDSPSQKIELNIPKGCYIVKIGDVVRKISVR